MGLKGKKNQQVHLGTLILIVWKKKLILIDKKTRILGTVSLTFRHDTSRVHIFWFWLNPLILIWDTSCRMDKLWLKGPIFFLK